MVKKNNLLIGEKLLFLSKKTEIDKSFVKKKENKSNKINYPQNVEYKLMKRQKPHGKQDKNNS